MIKQPIGPTKLIENLKKIMLSAERHIRRQKTTVTAHNAWSKVLVHAALAMLEVSRLLNLSLPDKTRQLTVDCLAGVNRTAAYHSLSSAGGAMAPTRESTKTEQAYSIYKADYALIAINSAIVIAKIYALEAQP